VTIISEPLGVTALSQPLTGAEESVVLVNSVAGFPDEGGLVIGSEIILYKNRNTVNNSFGTLTRGAWNTVRMSHETGDQVSGSYLQGTVNAPVMKLTVSCDGFQVRWYSLRLQRVEPAGIKGNDTDVKAIRVSLDDNGNGVLDRDPSTGALGGEVEVSSGTAVFGNVTGGIANIKLAGSGIDTKGNSYILITTTPTVYWVTMDIDQTATKGAVICADCPTASNFVIGAREPGDPVHRIIDGPVTDYPGDPFPFRSGYMFVYATVDTLQANYEPYLYKNITQNEQDKPMMELKLKANQNTVVWQGLRINLTGNCIDNDVTLIKIWRDLNENDTFDEADKQIVNVDYLGLLSYGTENFADKTATIMLKNPEIISSTGTANYFVTYNVNSLAAVGNTMGLTIASTGSFIVDTPDLVEMPQGAPYVTSPIPVKEYEDIVTFEPYPWFNPAKEKDVLAGVTLTQGDKNVPVLRFRLKTDVAEAIWSRLRVERIGTGVEKEIGRDSVNCI
jgi:hypothetical protein